MSQEVIILASIVGGLLFYILMAMIVQNIFIAINVVKYFVLAIVARMPMEMWKVTNIDVVMEDVDSIIVSRVFWPFAISFYILWAIWTTFTEFAEYSSSNNSRTPKWLTLKGWVEYTNRMLGLNKE